jgi:chromosomal replication initiation ATPase DnaA
MNQLVLNIAHDVSYAASDYVVSESNRLAFDWVENWPNWNSHGLVIVGEKDSGKTHLATIWAEKARARFICTEHLDDLQLDKIVAADYRVVIDDVASFEQEQCLFHMLNTIQQYQGWVVLTSTKPIETLDITLPDLRSRLMALPQVTISQPDDGLMTALFWKLFSDRQLMPDQAIIRFLVTHGERSFSAAHALVEKIDHRALSSRRNITLPFVRQAILG